MIAVWLAIIIHVLVLYLIIYATCIYHIGESLPMPSASHPKVYMHQARQPQKHKPKKPKPTPAPPPPQNTMLLHAPPQKLPSTQKEAPKADTEKRTEQKPFKTFFQAPEAQMPAAAKPKPVTPALAQTEQEAQQKTVQPTEQDEPSTHVVGAPKESAAERRQSHRWYKFKKQQPVTVEEAPSEQHIISRSLIDRTDIASGTQRRSPLREVHGTDPQAQIQRIQNDFDKEVAYAYYSGIMQNIMTNMNSAMQHFYASELPRVPLSCSLTITKSGEIINFEILNAEVCTERNRRYLFFLEHSIRNRLYRAIPASLNMEQFEIYFKIQPLEYLAFAEQYYGDKPMPIKYQLIEAPIRW